VERAGLDQVEDPGHVDRRGGDAVDLVFLDEARDLTCVPAVDEDHGAPRSQWAEQRAHPPDVPCGPGLEAGVVRVVGATPGQGAQLGHEGLVGMHDALRVRGRTRGVDDEYRGIGSNGRWLEAPAAPGLELAPVGGADGDFSADDDALDLLERGHAGGAFEEVDVPPAVGADEEPCT
jgi:hypothetical protein